MEIAVTNNKASGNTIWNRITSLTFRVDFDVECLLGR
jgi:hypothetical protein